MRDLAQGRLRQGARNAVVEAIASEFAELLAVLRDKILVTLVTPSATLSLANLTMAALIDS